MSWETVVEWDVAFARSRRRAVARRAISAKRAKLDRIGRAVALALVALSAIAVATKLVDTAPATLNAPQPVPAQVVNTCRVKTPYERAFRAAAHKTGLPIALLVAVAWQESRLDPRARSAMGAQGLLQLMPATAQILGSKAYDPTANIGAGARYLSQMLDRFGGNVELALAAYNAGPTMVERLGRAPSIETLRYAKNVEARAAALAACRISPASS